MLAHVVEAGYIIKSNRAVSIDVQFLIGLLDPFLSCIAKLFTSDCSQELVEVDGSVSVLVKCLKDLS